MTDLEIHFNAPEGASPEDLAAYLDKACGDDAGLRSRVEALFAAQEADEAFMAGAPIEGSSGTSPDLEAAGSLIGHFKLLQKIGEGGFGVVYMADQLAPVKRRVALKIIKLGMDTKQVVARFEVERQALAMMDHPSIAKVHDAGATETGRPYFVMELVRGIAITKFCEEQKLDTQGRLTLFIEVCSAIQHAHQKGIIHRDLKPSNVLVTLHDDKAVPKVIDFGVAKATQQDLTDKTLFTQFEQFIGTPAYMSPEQAQMSGLDIDTRSDIYSLGVLLYELLTGTTPFDAKTLAESGQDEVRRVIREEEPPKPSTRLTELQQRTHSPSGSVTTPSIDQDLDWIVMKALEKDRKRRYETANGLAMDIRRHLSNEPVEAAAPSAAYRFQKYARRHRAALGMAAAIAGILIVATAVSTWQAVDARRARNVAQSATTSEQIQRREAEDQERIAKHRFVEELLESSKTARGIALLARLIRTDPTNHIAGERLMSALQMREFPRLRNAFPISYSPAFSPDSSLVVTTSEDEQSFQVWDADSGLAQGEPFSALAERKGRTFDRGAEFHPDPLKPWIVTYQSDDPPHGSLVQVWNWKTGEAVGKPVTYGDSIHFAKFSPTGEFILSGGSDTTAKLTRADSGELHLPVLKGWTTATCAAFSPDEKKVVIVHGRSSQVWDIETQRQVGATMRHGAVWSVDFSPDGKLIATASIDHSVQLWNAGTGLPHGAPLMHEGRANSVCFSPDGSLLVTASNDGTARIWEVASGELVHDPIPHHTKVLNAKFHPKGHEVVTVAGNRVQRWDVGTGKAIGPSVSRGMEFVDAFFSPDGSRFLAHGPGGATLLMDAPAGPPLGQIFRHRTNPKFEMYERAVQVANFSPDGNLMVTGGSANKAKVWEVNTGDCLAELPSPWRTSWAAFSPDGALVMTTGKNGVSVWDTSNWKRVCKLLEGKSVPYAAFSRRPNADGDWQILAAPASTPTLRIWNARTGEPTSQPFATEIRETRTMVDIAAISPNERLVVTGSNEFAALLWDRDTGKLVRKFDGDYGQPGHADYIRSVAFSPDGTHVLTASNDQTARVWETATGRQVFPSLTHSDDVTYAAFSPDGRRIVTASRDMTARVWDATTGAAIGLPLQHSHWVIHAAFDPEGSRIVTASLDGSGRVWDAGTGLPLSEPLQSEDQVIYATFSPDGQRVVTTSVDGTARLWEVPRSPQEPIPDWIADWAEGVVGLAHGDAGNLIELPLHERKTRETKAQSHLGEDGYYARVLEWFYEDPDSRTLSPFSKMTLSDYVSNRMKEKTREGLHELASLEEVLRVAPDHASAYAAMAHSLTEWPTGEKEANVRRAHYYARQTPARDPE